MGLIMGLILGLQIKVQMDFIETLIKELGFAKVELREDGNYDCWNLHPWWVDTYSREELEYELNNRGDAV